MFLYRSCLEPNIDCAAIFATRFLFFDLFLPVDSIRIEEKQKKNKFDLNLNLIFLIRIYDFQEIWMIVLA